MDLNGEIGKMSYNGENLLCIGKWTKDLCLYKILAQVGYSEKGTSRQRSGKGAIRKRFPLQKPRWEKTKLTIRYLYHETYRKPNEQLFSQ